jgi:hypothetical protein
MGVMKNELFVVILIVLLVISVGIVSADKQQGAASLEKGPFTEFRLAASDPVANAQFGRSVAIAGDLVAVGEGGDGAIGAVYLYKRQGMTYVPEAKLVSPNATEPGAEFGRTVAIQGNTIFVGARFAPVGSLNAGAVYVFRKQGNSWHFEDKIVSPEPQEGDNFGRALAVQGNLLVVTARKNTAERGTAYVFEKTGDVWVHTATLEASDSADGDYFGQSVAVQGSFMVIGARNTAGPNGKRSGGFYLFSQSGDGWMEIAKVTPANGKDDDQYGFAIAIAGDKVVVTARREDPAGLKNAGAAYMYTVNGAMVELVTKLTPGDAEAGDEFGQSVAFAGDTLAIGAWKDDGGIGSIYLFRQREGTWVETGKITASDGVAGDEFGYSLAAFGNRMVTGAHFADSKAGAAYVLPVKS